MRSTKSLAQCFELLPQYVAGAGKASCAFASVSNHRASSAGTSSFPASSASIHDSSHCSADAILIGVHRIWSRHSLNRSGVMVCNKLLGGI